MDFSEEIAISISSPEQKSEIGGVNKFFVYTIRVKDGTGQFQISRRYSDFFHLRETLLKRWPGFYIPSLPEKKTIGSDDKLFVESRRRGLQYFLIGLSQNQRIWKSQDMEIFLKSTGESEKALANLSKQSFQRLLGRYRNTFPELQNDEIVKNSSSKISQFNSYLKGSKPILQKLSQMTQRMHQLYKRSHQKKLMLLQFLLPDYQKACLLENDQKKKSQNLLFYCAKNNGISESVQKYKILNQYPAVLLVSQQIKREKRQIQAFEELLKIRDDYESQRLKATSKVKDIQIQGTKINAGKQSFFSKLKKVSKEEQIAANQRQLQKSKIDQQNYTVLCKIVTNIIASLQIDRFKQKRQKAYFLLLKHYAKEEKALSEGETDIWLQVGRHDWIGLQESNALLKKDLEEQEQLNYKEAQQALLKQDQNEEKQIEIKQDQPL